MEKIKIFATLVYCVLIPYLILYPYQALKWQLNMAFLKPHLWENDGWVEAGVKIPLLTRSVYFMFWFPSVLCGVLAILFALYICSLFRNGILFEYRVADSILGMGIFAAASAGFHILAACVSPVIVSWHNPSGALPLRFWYSPEHLGLIFCGLGFILLGGVLRVAIQLADENEAFI